MCKKEATLGLTFVAQSRVKNVNDFLIHPFPLDRLTRIKNSSLLEGRVKEENRLNNIVKNTLSKYRSLFTFDPNQTLASFFKAFEIFIHRS